MFVISTASLRYDAEMKTLPQRTKYVPNSSNAFIHPLITHPTNHPTVHPTTNPPFYPSLQYPSAQPLIPHQSIEPPIQPYFHHHTLNYPSTHHIYSPQIHPTIYSPPTPTQLSVYPSVLYLFFFFKVWCDLTVKLVWGCGIKLFWYISYSTFVNVSIGG